MNYGVKAAKLVADLTVFFNFTVELVESLLLAGIFEKLYYIIMKY